MTTGSAADIWGTPFRLGSCDRSSVHRQARRCVGAGEERLFRGGVRARTTKERRPMTIRILLAGAAVAGLLSACDQAPSLPPLSYSPPIEALPYAPPVPVAQATRADPQAYWNEAATYDAGYADVAPDYGYDYGQETPAVWTRGGDILRIVERLTDGGERYYYYRQGQDYPYFVRDPDYAYAYDNRSLAGVYDVRSRRALDRQYLNDRAPYAGRYLARADDLRRAARKTDKADRRAFDRNQWQAWQRREDRRDIRQAERADQRPFERAERRDDRQQAAFARAQTEQARDVAREAGRGDRIDIAKGTDPAQVQRVLERRQQAQAQQAQDRRQSSAQMKAERRQADVQQASQRQQQVQAQRQAKTEAARQTREQRQATRAAQPAQPSGQGFGQKALQRAEQRQAQGQVQTQQAQARQQQATAKAQAQQARVQAKADRVAARQTQDSQPRQQ